MNHLPRTEQPGTFITNATKMDLRTPDKNLIYLLGSQTRQIV